MGFDIDLVFSRCLDEVATVQHPSRRFTEGINIEPPSWSSWESNEDCWLLPIVDIILVPAAAKIPSGFERITNCEGKIVEFNKHPAGRGFFLCAKRLKLEDGLQEKAFKSPITSICVIRESKSEFLPYGFELVKGVYNGQVFTNLKAGSAKKKEESVSICVVRGEGRPIIDLRIASESELINWPVDMYSLIERTPLGFDATLGADLKQSRIWLTVRRSVSELNPLAEYVTSSRKYSSEQGDDGFPLYSWIGRYNIPDSSYGKLTWDQLKNQGADPKVVNAVVHMLKYCYSDHLPTMIASLRYLSLLVEEDIPEIDISTCTENSVDQHIFSLGDAIVKTVSDCIEQSFDIIFAPAIHVLLVLVKKFNGRFHPVTGHNVMRAFAQLKHFFSASQIKTYLTKANNKDENAHCFSPDLSSAYWEKSRDQARVFESEQSVTLASTGTASVVSDGISATSRMSRDSNQSRGFKLIGMSYATVEEIRFSIDSVKQLFNIMIKNCGVRTLKETPEGLNKIDPFDELSLLSIIETIGTASAHLLSGHNSWTLFSRKISVHLLSKFSMTDAESNLIFIFVWICGNALANPGFERGKSKPAKSDSVRRAIISIQMVKELLFLMASEGKLQGSASFYGSPLVGCLVRQFVFPLMLSQLPVSELMLSSMELACELWANWRFYLKAELAIYLKQIIYLFLDDMCCPVFLRRSALQTVLKLFQDPTDLLDFFVNFQNEAVFHDINLFDELLQRVPKLVDPKRYLNELFAQRAAYNRNLQLVAAQSFVKLSGTLLLAANNKNRIDSKVCWNALPSRNTKSNGVDNTRKRSEQSTDAQLKLVEAFRICEQHNLSKAVQFLLENDVLENTPASIARFLHCYHEHIGLKQIGEYLCKKPDDSFYEQLRLSFIRALPLRGKKFEECIRIFLADGHFLLPGEAQQVDTLMESFSAAFILENPETYNLEEKDVFMMLSFTIVMLNTDLHNPAMHRRSRMTEDQFVRQVKMIGESEHITDSLSRELYQSISKTEIKMNFTRSNSANNAGSSQDNVDGKSRSDDVRKINENARVIPDASVSYESLLPDFNVNEPVYTRAMVDALFFSRYRSMIFQAKVLTNSCSLEWMPYHDPESSTCLKVLFESTWTRFYSFVNTVFENIYLHPIKYAFWAADTLLNCLELSVVLDMTPHKKAFATQLAKYYYIFTVEEGQPDLQRKDRRSFSVSSDKSLDIGQGSHLKTKWFEPVVSLCPDNDAESKKIMEDIGQAVRDMKAAILDDHMLHELRKLGHRFDNGFDAVLKKGRRLFLEGVLHKSMGKKKNFRKYQFFLFNDILLYASRKSNVSGGGRLQIHRQMNLEAMLVRDFPSVPFAFEVIHPTKKFVVVASDDEEKKLWMLKITNASAALLNAEIESLNPGSDLTVTKIDFSNGIGVNSGQSIFSMASFDAFGDMTSPDHFESSTIASKLAYDDDTECQTLGENTSLLDTSHHISRKASQSQQQDESASRSNENDENRRNFENTTPSVSDKDTDASELRNHMDLITTNSNSLKEDEEAKAVWLVSMLKKLPRTNKGKLNQFLEMDDRQLSKQFSSGFEYCKPILTNTHSDISANDEDKLLLYAYFKQGTKGDNTEKEPPLEDSKNYSKYKTWQSIAGTEKRVARAKFLNLLEKISPDWNSPT